MVAYQDRYYHEKGLYNRSTTGARWAKRIIVLLWRAVLKAWETRNDFAHGRETEAQRKYAASVFEKRVHDCYAYLPQLCGTDRDLFHSSAADTLSKPPHQIETWLTLVESLIKQAKKENTQVKRRQRIDEHYKHLRKHNERMRALAKKQTKQQDIAKFLRPSADVRAKSH
jgi:hypothetical protein